MLDRGSGGDSPAEAVADDADLASLACRLACGGDVGEHLLEVELTAHRDAAADFDVFGGVAELDAGTLAIEDRRGDGQVSGSRISIGDGSDVAVDAEDLLHDHDSTAGRSLGFGAVCGELEAVGLMSVRLLNPSRRLYFAVALSPVPRQSRDAATAGRCVIGAQSTGGRHDQQRPSKADGVGQHTHRQVAQA